MNARTASRYGRRNRAATLACVGAYLACSHALWSEEATRAGWHFVLVLTFGYGHLFGSAAAALRSSRATDHARSTRAWRTHDGRRARERARGLADAFGLALVTAAPLAYSALVTGNPLVVVAMLAVATWHTVENDAAFEAWYRNDFRAAPLGRDAVRHAGVIGTTLIVMALSAASLGSAADQAAHPAIHASLNPEQAALGLRLGALAIGVLLASGRRGTARRIGRPLVALAIALPWRPDVVWGITFADLFAASTLHHLVSWTLALTHRIRAGRDAGLLARRLALWHLTPVAVALAALFAPFAWRADLAAVFFSPTLYLYFALLHVAQTLAARAKAPH